jgi:Holliday junction resolvasome RuvABC endonuclease subunit
MIKIRKKTTSPQKKNYTSKRNYKRKKTADKFSYNDYISSYTFPIRILSIDPGTDFLGWAISDVYSKDTEFVQFGTVYGKGTGISKINGVVDDLREVIIQHKPDICTIEDYVFIKGKRNGMFVVPGLIYIIKLIWYKISKREALLIPSTEWKQYICKDAKASKLDIVKSLNAILDKSIIKLIKDTYSKVRGKHKGNYGEQDCYDAIGQNIYIRNNIQYAINTRIQEVIL